MFKSISLHSSGFHVSFVSPSTHTDVFESIIQQLNCDLSTRKTSILALMDCKGKDIIVGLRIESILMCSIKMPVHFVRYGGINRALEELLRDNKRTLKIRILVSFIRVISGFVLVACTACKFECTKFLGINFGFKTRNRVRD